MGWLFAVALGMQEDRSAAVWRAIVPIGIGHACSMRIGVAGLGLWSFLIATAHGAGLMVLPVWLRMSATGAHAGHPSTLADASLRAGVHGANGLAAGLAATAVHSGAYLLVTAAIAWLVFEKLGVGLLRKAWINLDVIWAAALILSGGLTVLLPPG